MKDPEVDGTHYSTTIQTLDPPSTTNDTKEVEVSTRTPTLKVKLGVSEGPGTDDDHGTK